MGFCVSVAFDCIFRGCKFPARLVGAQNGLWLSGSELQLATLWPALLSGKGLNAIYLFISLASLSDARVWQLKFIAQLANSSFLGIWESNDLNTFRRLSTESSELVPLLTPATWDRRRVNVSIIASKYLHSVRADLLTFEFGFSRAALDCSFRSCS